MRTRKLLLATGITAGVLSAAPYAADPNPSETPVEYPAISEIAEGPESGASLSVTGIDTDGTIQAGVTSVVYTLTGALPLSPEATRILLATRAGNQNITSWFDIQTEVGKIALKADKVRTLIDAVSKSDFAHLTFALSTADYEQTYGFSQGLQISGPAASEPLSKTLR